MLYVLWSQKQWTELIDTWWIENSKSKEAQILLWASSQIAETRIVNKIAALEEHCDRIIPKVLHQNFRAEETLKPLTMDFLWLSQAALQRQQPVSDMNLEGPSQETDEAGSEVSSANWFFIAITLVPDAPAITQDSWHWKICVLPNHLRSRACQSVLCWSLRL